MYYLGWRPFLLVKAHRQGLHVHISQAHLQHPAHGRIVDIEGLPLNNVTRPVVCAVVSLGVNALERAHPGAQAPSIVSTMM
jgi:hypothetical protein